MIRADLADNRIEVGQVTEDDGGSKKFAAAQARSVTDLINAIIELGDATITKYAAYKIGHTDDIPIGGPSSNGEKWHFKSPAHAVDVIASQMLSKIGLTFQDADYQRLYDELPKNSKFAANLLDAFGKLSVFNAVADDIDIYRTLLELDPQNEDLAAAIQTHDGALAEGLVQEVVMDEHPDGTSGPITGGGKSDLLLGAKDQPSLVRGNKGDDTIVSGGGEDTLDGGTGGDTLYALADDTVIPGAGDDIVFLIDGYANVLPSDGDDIVFLPSTMEESSIINFDGGLTQVQVPGQDAFWLSDVEAIGFADGEVLRLPDQKSQVAYLNTDDTIGTNDFVVEFNLTLTDENLTSDLISFSHDGKNEMTIGVLEGRGLQFTLRSDATQYGTISFYDRSGTAAVSVGQEHNIKLVAYSSENASIDSHFRLFVDDKMISDGSILTKFSNGVVDRGRPFDLAKIDRVDVAKSGEVKDDGTVGPLGAFVSGVSLAKLGLNGPSSPIVFGEDALGISGPLFWVDKSGKRTEVFDGTSADLSIGELGIDNGRFILTPTDLDVLEDGQKFSESITLRAATGETVDLQFEVIGAAEPEPQPTPEYPDTLIPDEVETPLQPMLEVVRIAGNQNMRETSGNVPAELVPSAEDERVLVTKYGTLVIEPSGRWTWTSDQQALRSLGQDETFSLTHVLGGVEFQFDIVGLDDRPMTGGTSNTTLIVNDTNELTGSISIVDPDLSDNPSFAGARAGGQYGTAVVADDGNTFTYMIDFSVPAPVGNVFTEKLTFLASDGETKKTVQINLWSRGSMLEDHWGNGTEPDPQPTPEYPDFLVTDEVEPLARPELEVVRITGTQWLREASGRIDPSLVPSVAEDRVLVTDYGRLEIASNGPWTWTSDFDALRALDQGEAFNEAFVVGGVEFRFEIAGMEDPAQTGGVIYTHLQLDETNSVSGEITVFDPDAGDNPSFAGTVAEGKYGTAIVSTNGDLFTYTIDHSLSPPPGNHFTESLIFLADDGETSKPVTVNLYTQNGNFSDHWSNDEPAPVIGVDASDTGLF